jgi:hypothetical protein
MPQFDIITFYSQIFWLAVIFFGFYNFTLRIFLPKITAVLKTRNKRLLLGSATNRRNDKQIFEKVTQNTIISDFSKYLLHVLLNKELEHTTITFYKTILQKKMILPGLDKK